jgi:hypothetical protein
VSKYTSKWVFYSAEQLPKSNKWHMELLDKAFISEKNRKQIFSNEIQEALLDDKRDVDDHLKRMERIRKYPPAEVVGKKMLGAMAGGVVDGDTRGYAYESGFFVLELTGDTVQLIPPPDGFVPKKW